MKILYSSSELNELKMNTDMVLVYFGSESCSVCRDIMPKLKKMLEKYPSIKGVKVEGHSLLELCAQYSVFTFPVIILFVQGKETIREAGIISLLSIEEKVARYYKLFIG